MKVLAIDTAANLCAACVLDTNGIGAVKRSIDIGKGHVEHLMPMIATVLEAADCAFRDLDRIAVATGPGSFTGVRVAVAAARGFALALRIPAIGVNTLEAIAAQARDQAGDRPVLVALDARRDEIYTAAYGNDGTCLSEPVVSTATETARQAEQLEPFLAGSAARDIAGLAHKPLDVGLETATADIEIIARLGAGATPEAPPRPTYLRAPDAKPQTGFAMARSGL